MRCARAGRFLDPIQYAIWAIWHLASDNCFKVFQIFPEAHGCLSFWTDAQAQKPMIPWASGPLGLSMSPKVSILKKGTGLCANSKAHDQGRRNPGTHQTPEHHCSSGMEVRGLGQWL